MASHLAGISTVIVLFCSPHFGESWKLTRAVNNMQQQESTQQEARRIWEKAIAAKGGRDRLYGVGNMVISERGEYKAGSSSTNRLRKESFILLPNKLWEWDDLRPDVFGLTVNMYNFDTRISYHVNSDASTPLPHAIPDYDRGKALQYGLLPYLLETKWLRPTLVSATTARIGRRNVNVVRTRIQDVVEGFVPENTRIDFAFDRETHLPIQISFYHMRSGEDVLFLTENLSDYTDASGIKVPQQIRYSDGTEYKEGIKFNVQYNKDLFDKPPSVAAGPEAWRPKRNE